MLNLLIQTYLATQPLQILAVHHLKTELHFSFFHTYLVSLPRTFSGRPGGIRTPNHQIWSLPLYQLELLAFTKNFLFTSFPCEDNACGIESNIFSNATILLSFFWKPIGCNYALYMFHKKDE
jgi:hypothetical protein